MAEKHDALGGFKDYNDLYDADMPKIARAWQPVEQKWDDAGRDMKKPGLYGELKKMAEENLFKAGYRGTLTYSIMKNELVMEVHGRVEGAAEYEHGFDHEKKRAEVLKANERGEKWLGQKDFKG